MAELIRTGGKVPLIAVTRQTEGIGRSNLLPASQLVPNVSNLIEGRVFDWSKPDEVRNLFKQARIWNTSLYKIVITMTRTTGIEVDQAADALREDLSRFRPDRSLFSPDSLTEWWGKLSIGMLITESLNQIPIGTALSIQTSNAIRQYRSEVIRQTETAVSTVKSLNIGDLAALCYYADFCNFCSNEIPINTIFTQLLDPGLETWKRLKNSWNWPQISQIVSLLPRFRSKLTSVAAVEAMELNVIDHPPKPTQVTDLDTTGVLALLKFRWQERVLYLDDHNLAQHLETAIDIGNLPVPRKYLPSTAIELLTHVQPSFLEDIHKEVAGQPDIQTSWLLTLLALRTRKPFLGTFVDQALADLTGLSPHIRDILLNQQPGQLWLTAEGKISTTKKGGFPIFTSSAVPSSSKEQPSLLQVESAEKQPEVNLSFEQTTLPFFGTVNSLRGEVQKFIGLMFQKGSLRLDLDKLYEHYEPLSQRWHQATYDRSMLYLYPLNSQDLYMNLAKKINIEAVFIEKDNIYFVSTNNGNLEALAGRLDKQGQLHIQDTNSSFIGESEQLFLNNLALHLITQPLHESGIVKSYGKEDRSAINALAASWNRMQRGSLPKIGFSEKSAYIVARLEDGKVVLLGEVAKNG